VFAQSYPVQVNISLTPPYSAFLTDYSAPEAQKFTATFLLRDLNVTDYKGKLRLTIEGVGITIRTKANYIPINPITLYGGESLTLFGEDLEEYFNPNNLDFAGISRSQYEKGAKLPEGVYRFTLEMLDYNRSTLVSNKGTAVAWVILNDPPLLNLPRNDSKAKIIDPVNIAFTWTPRHTGSPNSAFSTEYIFKLVEVWPATRNPYDAFLSQQPLYETTTTATQIVYGPAEPALIPGRKYAWQVQATDTEGRDLFKNQGKSEVYVFQFGDELGTPENFRQDGGNSSVANLRWEPAQNGAAPQQYRVRYRKKSDRDRGIWYETVTNQLWIAIPSLQPDTEYEMQIRAESKPQVSEYSTLQSIRTDVEGTAPYTCGTDGVVNPVTNTNLLLALVPGDIITLRNFKILVTDVTGSAGNYTGRGWLKMPWFNGAGVRVNFAGQVNTNHELIGVYESVYNQGSPAAQAIDDANNIGKDTNQFFEKKDSAVIVKPDYTVPGTIASINVKDDGKIIVVDTKGNESTFEPKKDEKTGKTKDTVIADSSGNSYTVGADGTITKKPSAIANSTPDAVPQNNFEKLIKSILDELNDLSVIQEDSVRNISNDYGRALEDAITSSGYKDERFLVTGDKDQYISEGFSKQISEPLQKSKSSTSEDQKIIVVENSYVDLYISDTVLVSRQAVTEKIKEYKSSSFAALVKEMQQMLATKSSKEREPLEKDKDKLKAFLVEAIRKKLRM
jgi:hypothetical protein